MYQEEKARKEEVIKNNICGYKAEGKVSDLNIHSGTGNVNIQCVIADTSLYLNTRIRKGNYKQTVCTVVLLYNVLFYFLFQSEIIRELFIRVYDLSNVCEWLFTILFSKSVEFKLKITKRNQPLIRPIL